MDSAPQRQSHPARHSQFPRAGGHPMGLVKQAYSARINDPRSSKGKKWHITAYFTQGDLNGLPTPTDDPRLRNVVIPSGVYRIGKARTRDPELDANTSSRTSSRPSSRWGQQDGSSSHNSNSYHYSSVSTSTRSSSASTQYEGRFPEDQRLIQMLNSQHIM